jgi:hypothetical protein
VALLLEDCKVVSQAELVYHMMETECQTQGSFKNNTCAVLVKIIYIDTRPRVYYYSSNRNVIYMSVKVVKTLPVTSVINHKENVQELEHNWNWQELRHKKMTT